MIRPREVGAEAPERLLFDSEEAALCVRALTYHVRTSLFQPEQAEDTEAFNALTRPSEEARASLEATRRLVEEHAVLAGKFAEAISDPNAPVELTVPDIERIGSSLYHLGVLGLRHAKKALVGHKLGYMSSGQLKDAGDALEQTAMDGYTLFKRLEPIAQAKGIKWNDWGTPLAGYDTK